VTGENASAARTIVGPTKRFGMFAILFVVWGRHWNQSRDSPYTITYGTDEFIT
jgi:hypothetical protein